MNHPWGTTRRLNTYSDYFRRTFGTRIQKITLDAGFTCPNRDGTCGTGGCTFCDNRAFNPSYNDPSLSITEQLRRGMDFHRTRYRKVTRYLAYFQAYTNTYGDLDTLASRYEEALKVPGIVGIVIGTRPDSIDDTLLGYLEELSQRTYLVVEYGIESIRDLTLIRVNRGHTVEQSARAVRETAGRGIRVGGHVMIGLPGEGVEDFLEMADQLSRWPLNNIKFHQLQIIRGTAMADEFREKPDDFLQFTMEEYLELMVRVVERLRPDMVVERIAGEVAPGMGIRQGWGVRYDSVLRRFEELLERYDTWQGKHYQSGVE